MDIGVWLGSLGLGRYEAAFSDNSIDADVLPELTDGDLAQLGVNLGDRKRLLKAIASLGAAHPVTKSTRPPPLSSSTDGAERRPMLQSIRPLAGGWRGFEASVRSLGAPVWDRRCDRVWLLGEG